MGLIRLIQLMGLLGLLFFVSLFYLARRPSETIQADATGESPFGLIGNNAAQASELNAFWTKLVIPWQLVEPAEAEFNFGPIDQELERIGPINVVGLIQANAPWAISCRRFVGIGNSCPTKDANQYAQFVLKIVSQFKDRIKVWQIEDEVYSGNRFGGSSDDYLVLLEAAALAIRQADPDATILVASTNLNTGKEYRQRLTSVLTQTNLYDVIDLHLTAKPDAFRPEVERFTEQLRADGIDKPIWVTELRGTGAAPEDLVKSHVAAFALGIEKVFWLGELDELSKKAYSLMASLLTKHSISQTLLHTAITGAVFEFNSGKPLAIVWSKVNTELNVGQVVGPPQRAFDSFGRKLQVRDGRIEVSGTPIYLVGSSTKVDSKQLTGGVPSGQARLTVALDKRSLKPGELGGAVITIEQPRGVQLAEVALSFPADLVRVKRINHTGSDFGLVLTERIDNTRGLVQLTKARVLRSDEQSLTLAALSFEAVAPGSGSFSFSSSEGALTRVLNLSQQNLLGALTSADFTVQ